MKYILLLIVSIYSLTSQASTCENSFKEPSRELVEKIQDPKQSLRGMDLREIDFSKLRVDLKYRNLKDAKLQGANLKGVDCTNANFEGVNLRGATLDKANFNGAKFNRDTILEDVSAVETHFSTTQMQGLKLKGNFTGAKFIKTDLSDSVLSGNFEKAIFTQANESFFTGPVKIKTNMNNVQLDGNFKKARFIGVIMRGARLKGDFQETIFKKGTDIREAKVRANLQGAEFDKVLASKADISKSNLEEAKISETSLQNSVMKETSFKEAKITESNLSGSMVNGTDFSGVKIKKSDLRFIENRRAHRYKNYSQTILPTKFVKASINQSNLGEMWLPKADFTEAQLFGTSIKKSMFEQAIFYRANLLHVDMRWTSFKKANTKEIVLSDVQKSTSMKIGHPPYQINMNMEFTTKNHNRGVKTSYIKRKK